VLPTAGTLPVAGSGLRYRTGDVIDLLEALAVFGPALTNLDAVQVGGVGSRTAQTRNDGALDFASGRSPPIGNALGVSGLHQSSLFNAS